MQIGATGDQAFFDVVVGDDFQQFIELGDAQALTDVGLEQAIFFAVREAVGALEFDVFDGETTGVGGGCWQDRFGCLAGQFLEFFETPTLLFEQAILAFTDEVGFPGRGGGMSKVHRRKAQQSQAQPRHEGG